MSSHTTPNPRRVWFTLGGIFAFLLALMIYLYAFHDIPPPDPAIYQVEFKPVVMGENALEAFEKETRALRQAASDNWTELYKQDDRVLTFAPGCEDVLKTHIEIHRVLLNKFWHLVKNASRPLSYPGIDSTVDVFLDFSSSSAIHEGYQLGRAAIVCNAFAGAHDQAIADSLNLVAFAKELSQADGVMIQWLVTITCQMNALTALNRPLTPSLPTTKDTRAWLSQLQQAEIDPKDLCKCFRVETLAQVNATIRWKRGDLPPDIPPIAESWFERITLKPNMGLSESLDRISPLLAGLEKSWTSGWKALEEFKAQTRELYPNHNWRSVVHPNLTGRSIIAQNFQNVALFTSKSIQTVIHNRCLQTALALRIYELENGELPATLEDLVPSIFLALPEDPITGTPLNWNRQIGHIYSVGEDEKDDDGDFDPAKPMRNQKDWGILYPWHSTLPQEP